MGKVKKMLKKGAKLALANPGATMAMASKALSMAKFLASVINVEHKFKDTVFPRTPIYSTPSVNFISGVAQGDTQNGRNGDSIKLSSVSVKGLCTVGASATTRIVRIMLVNDRVSDGAVPALTDILDNSTLPNVYARYNPDNAGGRFKILYDKRIVVSPTTNAIKFNCYRKLRHHLKYTGTTANQSDASIGHLYVLLCSDDNAADTNTPEVEFNSCIRYVDN